jgi:hypothetical protein
MIDLLANIIGMLGTVSVVVAYFLLQLNKIEAQGLAFNLLNLIGAVLLIISLCVHFNLASFVIEIFWIAASLVGLFRYFQARKSTSNESA